MCVAHEDDWQNHRRLASIGVVWAASESVKINKRQPGRDEVENENSRGVKIDSVRFMARDWL